LFVDPLDVDAMDTLDTPAAASSELSSSVLKPAWRSLPAVAVFLSIFAAVLGSDLAMKYWSFANVADVPVVLPAKYAGDPNAYIPQHEPTVLIPYVLNLQLVYNTGAVFGLGKGARNVFILVSVVASIVVVWIAARAPANAWRVQIALALILAGALGNLYDRYMYGAVRDMFHMLPSTRLWPWVWNIADAALMLGVGVMFLVIWFSDKPPQTAATNRD
jgi:signal peptidase II